MSFFLKLLVLVPISIALAVLCVASTAGFFGQVGHWLELASHFRLFYLIGFGVCIVILLFMRCWRMIGIAVVFGVLNLIPIAELYLPNFDSAQRPHVDRLSVLQINTWGPKNPHHDAVLGLIKGDSPDLIGVTELTDTWVRKLKTGLSEDYPYQIVEKKFGGVALFSRFPLEDAEVMYTGDIQRPRIKCRLDLTGREITVIFAHTVNPRWQPELRNAELKTVALEAEAAGAPVIVFGDLNCSPWSYYFRRLMEVGNLRDTERGFRLQPTWTTHWYFPWVPIDHCLVSRDFVALERRVGPEIGSDHLPVHVTLGLSAEPN